MNQHTNYRLFRYWNNGWKFKFRGKYFSPLLWLVFMFSGDNMIKNKNYNKCMVCLKKLKLGEKIVLCPIQKVSEGWGNVVSIPIHTKCFLVEKD